jgi:uncharacterized protein (PEP-CTERM system associated)
MVATANSSKPNPVTRKLWLGVSFLFAITTASAFANDSPIKPTINSGGHLTDNGWLITPSISLGGQLTDNVHQSSDKQSAMVLTASPAINLSYKGSSRLKAEVDYTLTDVERFIKGGSNGDLYNQLNAYANAELSENLLYIDSRANISQFRKSLLSAPGNGILNGNNQSTVGTYLISPYFKTRFGTFATGLLKYTNSGALFNTSTINNINSNTLQGALNSGTQFNALSWALNYSLRDAAEKNGGSNQFEHYDVTLGYKLTSHMRVFGSSGYDNNDYFSLTSTKGVNWNAGLEWVPNRRMSLKGQAGHAYYGNTYGLNLGYRTRFTKWTASYSESVNDISQQILQATGNVLWSCPSGFQVGPSTTPPEGCSGGSIISLSQIFALGQLLGVDQTTLINDLINSGLLGVGLTNGVFLSKNFNSGVFWSKAKNSAGFNIFDNKRIYLQLGSSTYDESRGVSIFYGHKLDAITLLNLNLSYTNNNVPALLSPSHVDTNDHTYVASVSLTRQFQRKLFGSLAYRYTKRNSNINTYDFTESNLSALVNYRF